MKTKKILALSLAAVLLMAVTVAGTMAWLQDTTDTVTNTFTTTNIDIELDETTGDEYEVIPGVDLDKDPTITVIKGSEEAWLFAKVNTTADFEDYLGWEIAAGWTLLETVTEADGTISYVYYRRVSENSSADQEFHVLKDDTITVSEDLTNKQMDDLEATKPVMKVTAYAIQEAGEFALDLDLSVDAEYVAGVAKKAWDTVKTLETQYETKSTNGEGTNLTPTND